MKYIHVCTPCRHEVIVIDYNNNNLKKKKIIVIDCEVIVLSNSNIQSHCIGRVMMFVCMNRGRKMTLHLFIFTKKEIKDLLPMLLSGNLCLNIYVLVSCFE